MVSSDENDPIYVAVDKDKHSGSIVKWTTDHLITNNQTLVLIHVRAPRLDGSNSNDSNGEHIFAHFRAHCARKGVTVNEVVLEGTDVANTILDYIRGYHVTTIVLGASTRSALTRKFWASNVPTLINKAAPEYCAVYTISRGKPQSVRAAGRHPSPGSTPPRQPSLLDSGGSCRLESERGSRRGSPEKAAGDASYHGRWPILNSLWAASSSRGHHRTSALANSQDVEHTEPPGMDLPGSDNPTVEAAAAAAADTNIIAEDQNTNQVERLKEEVKQTMTMYSEACKQAAWSQQRAQQLEQKNHTEKNRMEQARLTEEAALALVEMEKAKCRAAIKAAEKARKIAEREAQKRIRAEQRAKREAEERIRALDSLSHNDVRYRKYTIKEIEEATNKFSGSMKIGEGGYGPVYKGKLDHTPVAIKVLRSDALQGRKQFHQEVEVLSCMRHPNMVILMGACPKYGCLVYEFMDNGSLEDRLFRKGDTPSIPWGIRFKIAAEVATALLFLHQAKPEPLVHRDLKPANILLDHNYSCKLSDVGLARLVPPKVADAVTQYRMTTAAGTFCYIDPEYQQTGKLGTKSDIYSLGVTLLQIITAKPPMGLTHLVEKAINEGTFKDLLDPTVPDWPVEEALSFAKLAMKCSELSKKDRPDLATEVLPELNRLRELGMTQRG